MLGILPCVLPLERQHLSINAEEVQSVPVDLQQIR